ELFTLTVKGEYSSYKDYPVILYQIQTKYRDEARPRAGVLRGREFLMKDSYSFDLDDEGLQRSYQAHRDAYIRIFDRLGLNYVIVSAMSGAMGGSASEEFLADAPTGEDTYVRSTASDYAANVEAVVTPAPPAQSIEDKPAAQVHHTPDTPTIETLVDFLNTKADLGRTFTAADTLKNVLVKTRQPGSGEWDRLAVGGPGAPDADTRKNVLVKPRQPGSDESELLAVGVPGDREVDMRRLEAAVSPADVAVLEDEDFAKYPFLVKGYIGPRALQENGVRYLVDPRVVEGTAWVTGADKPDHHVVDLVVGRDFTPDGTIEAAEIREGDPAPDGEGTLVAARGIEIGHIFALGRKFSDAFELDALGPDGKPVRITMGSYGIGVSRLVAAIAEQYHDELGLVWPREVAPADVHIVLAGTDDAAFEAGEELAGGLAAAGVRVFLGDRQATPGVKFAAAELVGVPTIVIVGKGLKSGVIEGKDRATGERTEVPVDEAVRRLVELVKD